MPHQIGRLSRLGFTSLPECLLSVPREYRDYVEPINILPIPDTGFRQYMMLRMTERILYGRDGIEIQEWGAAFRLCMRGVDGRGDGLWISIFGGFHPWKKLELGDEIHLYGQVTTWNGRRQITNPEMVQPGDRGKVFVLYRGKPGQVGGDMLKSKIKAALPEVEIAACLMLEQAGMRESEFRAISGFSDPALFLRTLHEPPSVGDGYVVTGIAKTLSVKAILNRAAQSQAHKPVPRASIPISREVVSQLVERLPFSLTRDQRMAVDEIVSDLRSPFPMLRLLSGDVNTGKTATYLVPAAAANLAGAAVAIIVPSQPLVHQIAGELRQYFPDIPVSEVVSGSVEMQGIVVGTTAILSVARKNDHVFDFVVTDEQHKFSVEQKTSLASEHTNVLEATATAIPRTLALVRFGGVDLSVLRESPVHRNVITRIVPKQDGARLYDFIGQVVSKGGQAAIVYPLAEEGDDSDLESVESAYLRFDAMRPGRVAMLHGKLGEQEKVDVIRRMHSGAIDLLVSSTVIEVGLTLPSLRAVVVVHAERFGLSQLHQLRGRAARRGGDGYFFMFLPNEIEEAALERLTLLVECSDGFSLAERDADLRGFGDIDVDSSGQTGTSRLLFWGITLSRREIESEMATATYLQSGNRSAQIAIG